MLYQETYKKIKEVEGKYLPECLVIEYVDGYRIGTEVGSTTMAIALIILNRFTALLARVRYLMRFFQTFKVYFLQLKCQHEMLLLRLAPGNTLIPTG